MKAVVSITWHGLVVRGCKLIEGAKGSCLCMPARKKGEEWEDVCYFVGAENRSTVTEAVLAEYRVEIFDAESLDKEANHGA